MRLSDIEVLFVMTKRLRKYIARARNGRTLNMEKRERWQEWILY